MLESIRDYGQHKLREAGEDAVLRRRHRDWYEWLAVRARAEGTTDRHGHWLTRLGRERSNLRAAVEFCLTEPGEADAALRVVVSLPRFYWTAVGVFGEGRHWLDRALAQATEPTALRARALLVKSQLAFWQGDTGAGMPLLDEGEALAHRLNASAALAYAAFLRGQGALFVNDLQVAVEALNTAWTTLSQDPDRDLDLYLSVLLTVGPAAGLVGDHQQAAACQQELTALVESGGGAFHRAPALWAGGLIAWLRKDLDQAAAQELTCLRVRQVRESHDRYAATLCLEVLAWITADQHRHRRAATLLGAADALWTDIGATVTSYGHLADFHVACERQLRDALGDVTFADAFHHGQALSYQDTMAYALDERRPPARAPQGDAAGALTSREREVAGLIAQGLSNKEIAATMVISQRTAESHVEHILAKLGVNSRAHVAAWITERTRTADGQ
jgi:DNA-binding NarL/FixJ family response regulator